MKKTFNTMLYLIGSALLCGAVGGILDLKVLHRSSLESYRIVQIGNTWDKTRSSLQALPQDCAAHAASSTPPSLVQCSDYWWTYSFRFDPQTGLLLSKRFSPAETKPLPLRLVR